MAEVNSPYYVSIRTNPDVVMPFSSRTCGQVCGSWFRCWYRAYPKGFPQNPMSDADVEAKFRACCADLLTAHQCDRALARLWSLEAQPNLKALFDTLVV
jgi:hypothetical protein